VSVDMSLVISRVSDLTESPVFMRVPRVAIYGPLLGTQFFSTPPSFPFSHHVAFTENCNCREVVLVSVIAPGAPVKFPRASA
jgi:hypothetical protein